MKISDFRKEEVEFYGPKGDELISYSFRHESQYLLCYINDKSYFYFLNKKRLEETSYSRSVARLVYARVPNDHEILNEIDFRKDIENGYYVAKNSPSGFILKRKNRHYKNKEYHYVMERTDKSWFSVPIGESENPKIFYIKDSENYENFDQKILSGEFIEAEIEKIIDEN